MKTFGRVILFALLCAASAAALLLMFPGLKEGFSRSEFPLLLGVVAALVALGGLWWFAGGRGAWRPAGLVILAVPAIVSLVIVGRLIAAQLEGARLAERLKIENYREESIRWDGLDGPVGLTVAFNLVHPAGSKGVIYPPQVRMGRFVEIPNGVLVSTRSSGGGYFKDHYLEQEVGPLALLMPVTFQALYEPRFASRTFAPGRLTRLTYHLYPGTLVYLESEARFCLGSRSAGIARCTAGQRAADGCVPADWGPVMSPLYHEGGALTALWLVAGGFDMVADLSHALTTVLRRESALQNDPQAWSAIHERLEPDNLIAAGYRLCPRGRESHDVTRVCFCRAG
ncbi:MAG: hypothetical protein OEM93_15770 [Rhodospirillales bacterium]|nr:hypothetical protein [Rhodospirillales bacterium]MDH3919562.1 hypothetical protein [Rhodospirillales bacterium]MDH3968977.1 hypothetical protein [Rhodospirillales bacterium]